MGKMKKKKKKGENRMEVAHAFGRDDVPMGLKKVRGRKGKSDISNPAAASETRKEGSELCFQKGGVVSEEELFISSD